MDELQERRRAALSAWTTFVEQGDRAVPLVRPEIRDSWERSGAVVARDVVEAPLADESETRSFWEGSPLQTAVNGVAEELYFRGALYAAVGRHHAVLVTTVVYALTTVGTGIPLLVLAAAALGLLTALQRRVTGGVLGPVITHLTWSLGMLFLLPPVLETGA